MKVSTRWKPLRGHHSSSRFEPHQERARGDGRVQVLNVAEVQDAEREGRGIAVGHVVGHFAHVDGEGRLRADRRGGAEAVVQRGGEPRVLAALAQAADGHALRVDVRARPEVFAGAHRLAGAQGELADAQQMAHAHDERHPGLVHALVFVGRASPNGAWSRMSTTNPFRAIWQANW